MTEQQSTDEQIVTAICADYDSDPEKTASTLGWDVDDLGALVREIRRLRAETVRLRQWVSDCHAGMYINCVYCGHRYGPNSEVPAAMADVLKEHIERCPDHPMSKLKSENDQLREIEDRLTKAIERVLKPLATTPGGRMYGVTLEAEEILRGALEGES